MFRLLKYKQYQKQFCKQYVKRSNEIIGYEYFLRHCNKKEIINEAFVSVSLYDVLDNDGMKCLIKKIYKLKKSKEYDVSVYYRKSILKKLNYIHSNITGSGWSRVSEIKFINDKWITNVEIVFTYLNASEVIVEYEFTFRKVINTYLQIHNFVIDNILKIKKEWYFHTYADRNLLKNANCEELQKLDNIFFTDILQGYICTLFFTKYGKKYKLPTEYSMKIKNYSRVKARIMRNAFLCQCYEKKREHIEISSLNYDRFEFAHYKAGKYFPNSMLLSCFMKFPTEMYYSAFGKIELDELEHRMRKYLNSRKTTIASNDIKWLINKIRFIKEKEEISEWHLKEENCYQVDNILGWDCYISGEKKSDDLINYPKYTTYYLNLYNQNLEYLKSIASVQNDKVIFWISLCTLIATVLGIIVSVLVGVFL